MSNYTGKGRALCPREGGGRDLGSDSKRWGELFVHKINGEYESASAGNIEPMVLETTLAGAGATGGRARFQLTANVALGGWANALKAYTSFGASGRITGLASALCAEMDLSTGTTQGTYAPLELELNLGNGAKTGTTTSLIHANVNGDAVGEFDDHGYIMNIQGISADTGHVFQAAAVTDINSTHALRIKIGDTDYFIPLHTNAAFGG
jgi:hypothetical protein